MAQAVGDVVVALRADISPFQQGMESATRSMRSVQQNGRAMGAALSGAAGNVANLSGALIRAKGQMTAVQSRINQMVGATDRMAGAARDSAAAFRQFDQARAQVDALRSSYDPIFAASKRYEAAVDQLNNALSLGVIKQQEYDTALERLGQSYLTAEGQAQAFSRSMRASTAHTTNLMFQFQDIGMMLAAGQSPLMLAMQQGTQVSGIFQQMRNSGQSAFQGIIGGLGAMISPMSLVTIGAIAGGAALAQWGMKAMGATQAALTFDDVLGQISESMSEADRISGILQMSTQELREEYGAAAESVRQFAVQQAELLAAQASRRMADALSVANEELRQYVQTSSTALRSGTTLGAAMMNVARDFGVTAVEGRALSAAMRELRDAQTFDEQREALQNVLALMEEYGADLEAIPPELARAISEMITLTTETERARQLMAQLGAEARGVTIGTMLSPDDGNLLPPSANDNNPPGGGGGGGRGRDFAAEFEALQTQLMTESERIQLEYETRLDQLREFRENRVATEEEFNELERRINSDHAQQMRDMELQSQGARLSIVSGMMGDIATILESGGERNLRIVRGLKVAEALISGYQAAVDAWQQGMRAGGPGLAALYTAGSLARTGALIAQMQSAGSGGASGGGGAGAISAATAAPAPLEARLVGLDPNALYSGAQIDELLDQLMDAAGDRGLRLTTVAA